MSAFPRRWATGLFAPGWDEALRFTGFAIGVFVAMNLVGEALRAPFDTVQDWITLPGPRSLRFLVEALSAALLCTNALVPPRSLRARRGGALLFGFMALSALIDTFRFYTSLAWGRVHTPVLVPASLPVALLFAALAFERAFSRAPRPSWDLFRLARAAGVCAALAAALPLLRMATFGQSRYEREADCAVVFGARVYDDGTPSDALADRVDESIRLYHRGLVHQLLMSGAIDAKNGLSEPRIMKARAVAAGVPAEAILLDEEGEDTSSTARNAARILRGKGMSRALLVTHYYHEPRAKMLFDRAGIRAYTVPAQMRRRLLKEPYFIVREIAAFYHSWLFQ